MAQTSVVAVNSSSSPENREVFIDRTAFDPTRRAEDLARQEMPYRRECKLADQD
jgi:hypothetical protein